MRVFIIRGAACRTGHNDPCPVMKSCCLCSVSHPGYIGTYVPARRSSGALLQVSRTWSDHPAPSPRPRDGASSTRSLLWRTPGSSKMDRTGGGVLKHCAGWPMRLKRLGQKPGPGCFGSQRITMSSRSVPNRVCDATSPSTMRRAPASGGFGPARASRDGEDDLSDRQRVRNPDPEKTPRCLLAGHHGRAIPADEQPIWTPARRSRHHVLVETGVSVAHPRAG